jgi:hypothetical protein
MSCLLLPFVPGPSGVVSAGKPAADPAVLPDPCTQTNGGGCANNTG